MTRFSKKLFILILALTTGLGIFAFLHFRSHQTWSGFIYANFRSHPFDLGEFSSQQECIAKSKAVLKNKWAAEPREEETVEDTFLCGTRCFLSPDLEKLGGESLVCGERVSDSVQAGGFFTDDVMAYIQSSPSLPEGSWQMESMACENARWASAKVVTEGWLDASGITYEIEKDHILETMRVFEEDSDTVSCEYDIQRELGPVSNNGEIPVIDRKITELTKNAKCPKQELRTPRTVQLSKLGLRIGLVFSKSDLCENGAKIIMIFSPAPFFEDTSQVAEEGWRSALKKMNENLDQRLLKLKSENAAEYKKEMTGQKEFVTQAEGFCEKHFGANCAGSICKTCKFGCIESFYKYRSQQAQDVNDLALDLPIKKPSSHEVKKFEGFARSICNDESTIWKSSQVPTDCNGAVLADLEDQVFAKMDSDKVPEGNLCSDTIH